MSDKQRDRTTDHITLPALVTSSLGGVTRFTVPGTLVLLFSQPSIYIDGWLYGMRMTSVVCNVPVLSQNDSTCHHSVFTTWKWHPFATWTPSFIILVWGHHPPLHRTVFACLQNCYNSCISCSRSAIWFTLRYDFINCNLMNYSWTNGRLAIPALAGLLVCTGLMPWDVC